MSLSESSHNRNQQHRSHHWQKRARRMEEVVSTVRDAAPQVEVVKRKAEAEKVEVNKATQKAKAVKTC